MPHLSNTAVHFPTLHISDPTHECICVSLSNFIHPTAYISLQELKGPCITVSNICISLTPHMSVRVSLSQTSYIPITAFHCKSGRGPCVTPIFAHFCIILSIVFLQFLQHPERSQIIVRHIFVECRPLRHDLGIILQLCEHFLLSISSKSVLPKHTPY